MLSIFDQGPPKPCASPFNLSRHVLSRATELHDKIALSVLGPETAQNWTFGALEQAVRATGTGLLNKGLDPGDIVLMRLGNTVDFPIAYLGAISAGLVPVPTSSQLTETETASIISDLNIAAVLHDPLVASAEHPSIVSLAELRAMRDLTPCDWHMGDPERLAYVVYTSGTSGKPRAVAHAHRAIWARQLMVKGWYGLKQSDRLLHAGAFNWTYTLGTGLMDPWTAGATALIPEPGLDLGQIPALLNQAEATLKRTSSAAASSISRSLPLIKSRRALARDNLPEEVRGSE